MLNTSKSSVMFPVSNGVYGKSDTKLTLKLVNVYFALYKTDKNTAPNYREVRLCEKPLLRVSHLFEFW